jgi:hypothetical protein
MFTVKFTPSDPEGRQYSINPDPGLLAKLPVTEFPEAEKLYRGEWATSRLAFAAAFRLNIMIFKVLGIGHPSNLEERTHYYYLTEAGPLKKVAARYIGTSIGGYIFFVSGQTITLTYSQVQQYIRTERAFRSK